MRSQLRFLEDLEKVEQKRHDDEERDKLFRVAKSRSKHEDPEHTKLKEKAKAVELPLDLCVVSHTPIAVASARGRGGSTARGQSNGTGCNWQQEEEAAG